MPVRKVRSRTIIAWILISIIATVAACLAAAFITYPSQYIFRVIAWRESDAFDWQKFPAHPLAAAPEPHRFAEIPDDRVPALFSELAAVTNWDAFQEENRTQAFIVLHNGTVVYERYYNDSRRDSIVTSFSVAKSFASALIAIAIDEGYIASVDDPITRYLPELVSRHPRFAQITIRHLLLMSSGLEYQEFRFPGLNSDDALTTYYPDQRWLALNNTRIVDPPGLVFQYNKYHPQLLGMILERTTGMTVTNYLQTRLWDPLGMEFGGSWSTDSEESDFEKMETGVNARAIDFARFGQLFLNRGRCNGRPVIPSNWVEESTQPFLPADYSSYYPDWFSELPGLAYYTYMWWGMVRDQGGYDFFALGDRGQFIYVSPANSLVIVRNGIEYGIPSNEWLELFYNFASRY